MTQEMVVRGSVRTMDPDTPIVEAIAVSNGRVVASGGIDAARAALPKASVLDLGNTSVYPGFIDSHNHMLWTAMAEVLLDLSPARCVGDLTGRLRQWAADHPRAEWLVSSEGWEVNDLAERRYPTRWELDAVTGGVPVYLPRGGHAAVVNSAALERAGISDQTPDPPGGVIERDVKGMPTGLLLESARQIVAGHVPSPSHEQRTTALRAIQPRYLAAGITRVVEPGLTADELDVYLALHEGGGLVVRGTLLGLIEDGRSPVPCAEALWGRFEGDPRWGESVRFGGFKAFLDGGGSLGTAWLRAPYPHRQEYVGERLIAQQDLEALLTFASERRLPVGVHAVGGAAIDSVVQAAARVGVPGRRRSGVSLIHSYLWPSLENMRVAAELGVVAVLQPTMYERFAEQLVEQFGWEDALTASPLKSWFEAGVTVAGGSDSPVTPFEPLRGIWQAVTRYSYRYQQQLAPEECVSPAAAIEMYTRGSAILAGVDQDEGVLRPGSKADWVALSDDPMTHPKEAMQEIRPVMTAVDGVIVHEARP